MYGVGNYIEAVIGCDICQHHKPHPEPMEKALSALKLKAEECLCIGDSPFDLQSGQAAGCYVRQLLVIPALTGRKCLMKVIQRIS